MNNMIVYRLNSYMEILDIKNRIGTEAFNKYLYQIYTDLLFLKKKSYYPLEKTWEEIDMAIKVKICCLFISERREGDYEMNDNYNLIIHK